MKKILLCFLMLFCICGCSNKKLIDLDKVEEAVSTLKYQNNLMFTDMTLVDNEKLSLKYGVDTSYFEDTLIYMSSSIDSANMYAIFLPKEGIDATKEIDKFINKYASSWTEIVYNKEEANLVNNRLEETYGDYIIYIVSPDNEKVLETIINAK